MGTSTIKSRGIAAVSYDIANNTNQQTFDMPSGYTSDNCILIGAKCNTVYNSVIDFSMIGSSHDMPYWGTFQYGANGKFLYTPNVAGVSTRITFIFSKIA